MNWKCLFGHNWRPWLESKVRLYYQLDGGTNVSLFVEGTQPASATLSGDYIVQQRTCERCQKFEQRSLS